jgi:hypothetical protein
MEGETTVAEAVETVVDAVHDATAAEHRIAAATVESALEEAEERVEAAVQTAEQIAAAAIEGERGRRIVELENRMNDLWAAQESLKDQLASLAMRLTEAEQVTTATAILSLVSPSTPATLMQPLPETVTEAAETIVETVMPEQVSESAVVAAPAPVEKPRRKLFL